MSKLSIISHFYNHHQMVIDQIKYWETLPNEFLSQVEFILVDDCSDQIAATPKTKLNLKLFRIKTDITWNQGGARNLGAFNAKSD